MDAPEALTENMLVFLMKVSKDPKGILANPKKSSEIVQEFTRLMEDRSLPDFTTSLAAWLTERLSRLPTDNLIKRLKEYAFIVSLKSGILCVVEAIANRRYERLEAFNKTGDALIKRALREAADEEFDEDLINDYEWSSSSEEEPEQQQAGPDEYRPSLRPPLLDTGTHPDKAPQPEPETGGAEAENEPPPPEPEEDSHHEPPPPEPEEDSHHEPPPPEPEEDSHHEPFQVETESGPNFQAHGSSDVSDEEEQQSEPSHVAAKRRRLPRLPRLPKSPRPPPAQEEALVLQVPQIIITPATFIEEPASQADSHEEEAPPANDGEGQDESHAWPSSAMDNDDGFSLPPLEEEPAPIPRRRRRRRRRGRPAIDPITQLSDREIRANIENANMLSHPPGHLRALLLMQGQVGFQSARELLETPSIDRRQPMRDWIMRRFNDTRDERSRENGSTASGQIQPEVGPSSNTGSIPIEPSQNGSGAGGTDAPSAGQDGPIPGQNDSPPVAPAAPESPSAEDVPDVWIPDDGDNADVEPAELGPEIPPNETSMTIDVTSFLEPMPPVHEEGSQEEQPTLPGIPGPSSSIPGLDDNPAVASGAPGVPSVEEIADVSIPDDGDYPSEPRPEIPPNEPSMTPVVTSFLTPMPPVHEEGSQEEQPTLPGIPGPSSSTTSVGPPDPFDVDEIPAVEPSDSPPHPPPVSTGSTSRPPPLSPERLQEAQRRTAATMAELIARHATHVHKQKKVRLRYACLSEVLESVEVNCVSTAISSLFDMSDRGEVFLIQPTSNTEQIFIFPTRQAEDEQ